MAGFAAVTLVPEGPGVLTVERQTSCLRPGVGQRLRTVGWVLKAGRLYCCEAGVRCDELLSAKATPPWP